jgi:hypothetical protein
MFLSNHYFFLLSLLHKPSIPSKILLKLLIDPLEANTITMRERAIEMEKNRDGER